MEVEEFAAQIIALGGKRWMKGEFDRIYLDPRNLAGFEPSDWTNADWAAARNGKFWFDLTSGPVSNYELQCKGGAGQFQAPFWAAQEMEDYINSKLAVEV